MLLLRTIRPSAVLATGATDAGANLGGGSGNAAVNNSVAFLSVLSIHLLPPVVVFAALSSAAIFASPRMPFRSLPFCSDQSRKPKLFSCLQKNHKERVHL